MIIIILFSAEKDEYDAKCKEVHSFYYLLSKE